MPPTAEGQTARGALRVMPHVRPGLIPVNAGMPPVSDVTITFGKM